MERKKPRLAAVCGVLAVLLPCACSGAVVEPTQPVPSASPGGQSVPDRAVFTLNQDVDLVVKQEGSLRDSAIQVELLEARGVRDGCFDCPLSAKLKVTSGGASTELIYSFSGGMLRELLERAKRKTAFGYEFVAVKITEGTLTLRVERPAAAAP